MKNSQSFRFLSIIAGLFVLFSSFSYSSSAGELVNCRLTSPEKGNRFLKGFSGLKINSSGDTELRFQFIDAPAETVSVTATEFNFESTKDARILLPLNRGFLDGKNLNAYTLTRKAGTTYFTRGISCVALLQEAEWCENNGEEIFEEVFAPLQCSAE
jgi:hypothetical protein